MVLAQWPPFHDAVSSCVVKDWLQCAREEVRRCVLEFRDPDPVPSDSFNPLEILKANNEQARASYVLNA